MDSGDEDELSPDLLSAPDGDTVTTNTVAATNTDFASAPNGETVDAATATVDAAITTPNPTNDVLMPATKAAIMAAVSVALNIALIEHRSSIRAELASNLSTIRADMASNHGHITKRLYLPLETKLNTLASKLESKLASETTNLAAKGDSLLAKITSLDDTIRTNVGGRIAALETKIEAVTTTFEARITALEPPVRTPAMTTNSASTASAGNVRAGPTTAPGRGAEATPDNAPINVNARTRAAFDNARQLNPSLLTGDSRNHSHGCTPVRDPYNTSTNHGRHNPSPSQQPKRQTTLYESLGRGAQTPVNTRNTSSGQSGDDKHHHIDTAGDIHPAKGGGLISPPHRDRAQHARTLGASRFDVIRLASTKYHVGMEGLATLTEDDIRASGYAEVTATAEDTVICYKDIILAHRKVN